MLHAKFQDHRLPVPEKIFKSSYHIFTWRPSWSFDLDHLYKLWLPLPKYAPHKIGVDWPSCFKKKMFEQCERTKDHCYTISQNVLRRSLNEVGRVTGNKNALDLPYLVF